MDQDELDLIEANEHYLFLAQDMEDWLISTGEFFSGMNLDGVPRPQRDIVVSMLDRLQPHLDRIVVEAEILKKQVVVTHERLSGL